MNIFTKCDIMLPKKDFEKWAVIACDQFTGNSEYWEKVEEERKGYPSALDVMIPEIFLSDDNSGLIKKVNSNMKKYIDEGVFEAYKDSMIYVERMTSTGLRKGIVGAIDLFEYDYRKGSDTPVRATEETVKERIPPRVEVRKDALFEMPHILILIDDPENRVIAPLSDKKDSFKKAYSFDLMAGGGHIEGYFLSEEAIEKVEKALDCLYEKDSFVFALGDGNHSLASAKECVSEKYPKSRYALCEIVNIHDDSLVFEPIYRIVYNVEPSMLLSETEKYFGTLDYENGQIIKVVFKGCEKEISLPPKKTLTVATLTDFLDHYSKENPQMKIDYIHGEDEALRLSQNDLACAFLFGVMKKDELFPAVKKDGALVRKTFSMGCARDKRYYLEARMIK